MTDSRGPIFGLQVTAAETNVIGTALGVLIEVLTDQIAAMDTSTDAGQEEYLANLSIQATASFLFGGICTSFGKSKEETLAILAKISHHPTERNENDNP